MSHAPSEVGNRLGTLSTGAVEKERAMWVLIAFGVFALAVCIVAFLRGASTIEELDLSDGPGVTYDERHRDAA